MKTARLFFLTMGLSFFTAGLVFLLVAGWRWEYNAGLMENGIQAEGEYISVGKSNTRIRYEAEGQTWEVRSSFYSSDMDVGDKVSVWYKPGEPQKGQITVFVTWGVFLILGAVFGSIGAFFLMALLRQVLVRRALLQSGIRIKAQVVAVTRNGWVRFNGKSPYVVRAKCIHPYTGGEMMVSSEFIMEDPKPYLKDELDVLVHPMSEHSYYLMVGETWDEVKSRGNH